MLYYEVNHGKKDQPQQGLERSIVTPCITGANTIGQGYHVYMDNFFTSPTLLIVSERT